MRALALALVAALLGVVAYLWFTAYQWQEAQVLWRKRDPVRTYAAWQAIDPRTPMGQEARRRLAGAEQHYRRGIALLDRGEPGARDEFEQGLALAPMDPALYLPLARAYRRQQLSTRAVTFYSHFLTALPDHPEAPTAQEEWAQIDPDAPVWGQDTAAESDTRRDGPRRSSLLLGSGAAGLLLLLLGGLVLATRQKRLLTLATWVAERPELHPGLAYAIGCLRHELLKHRAGAAVEALRQAPAGEALETRRIEFVRALLLGDEPLAAAWASHRAAIERALGERIRLERRDVHVRAAGRALRRLSRLTAVPGRGAGERARARVDAVARDLMAFDGYLAAELQKLVRTRVDERFLAKVVESVRGELGPLAQDLDELSVLPPPEPLGVEMYGIDLRIILRNLLRNAIQATQRGPGPRRVRLDVTLTLEPTGEEVVRLRVHDTSPERFSYEALRPERPEQIARGLGLIRAATERYGGVIEVGPGAAGFAKVVAVRLFRALDEEAVAAAGTPEQAREAA